MKIRFLPLLLMLLAVRVPLAQAPSTPASDDPVLHSRTDVPKRVPVYPNRMQLDVLVTDAAGQPVTGLQPWDFNLLDNHHRSKILYFRTFDGGAAKPDPPVEVILVLDLLNISPEMAAFERNELDRYLRGNDGRLPQPVTLMVLSDKGLQVQARPSSDGNALAAVLKKVGSAISSLNPAMGRDGAIDRFNRCVKQIRFLAENESHKDGMKILVWIGRGWPMLESQHFMPGPNDQRLYFQAIVDLSNWFRMARMAVYSVSLPELSISGTGREDFHENFLQPVLTAKQAESGNLALRVLAIQTGGQVQGPSNDLAGQIQQCVGDANSFYQLTFEAPPAAAPDEYHALKVTVDRPGAQIRTRTGYYDEPASR